MPQVTDPTQSFTAVYDAWNRMVTISNGSTPIGKYLYDGRNFRIAKLTYALGVLSETRDIYFTAGWQDIEERIGGMTEDQYVWGIRYIDELICRDDATQRLYATQDTNFNLTAICDGSSGAVVERYAFDPYGARTITDAAWSARGVSMFAWMVGFQGLFVDVESGELPCRERLFGVALGMMAQRDPLGYAAPSLYESYSSNPISYTDPRGLFALGQDCRSVDRTAYLNFDSGDWGTFPLGPIPVVVRAKLNVTYGFQVKICDICCANGAKGTKTTTSVQVIGTALLSVTGGIDKSFDIDGSLIKVWAGIQGQFGSGISLSAAWESSSCSQSQSEGTDLCATFIPQVAVRVGGEARLQTGWWSWSAGVYGYGQLSRKGKLCWHCNNGACTFKGWTWDGSWTASIGIRACLGVCYTIGEWQIN